MNDSRDPDRPMSRLASAEGALSRATAAAARFYADSGHANAERLDEAVKALLPLLDSVDPCARLSPDNHSVIELLTYCGPLLSANTTNSITRSRLMRMLFQMALYNVPLRRRMAGSDHELCSAVFVCLEYSLKEQLGPQNMIDILRLMQVLTYEKSLVLGVWTNDLISFLLAEICREPEQEWMGYSIAILCNLAARSKSVCARIKKSSSYKQFTKRLLKLLMHDSRIVVVCALVLIGFLEEKLRDQVFSSSNMQQTFQCVFNVLIIGDSLMTRHIAADLLKRLVVSDGAAVSSIPVITAVGRELVNYAYFEKCVQRVAELIGKLDARQEETAKVYEVLLALCSLREMRSPVCRAILACKPTEERLNTPLKAAASTAELSFDAAIDPSVPIRAARMLNYILKEAVDECVRLASLHSISSLLSLCESSLNSPIETTSVRVAWQCQRVTQGIRMAEVLSGDDELRPELLQTATAPLCAHLAETQLMVNPVVVYMAKPAAQRSERLPEWSIHGVAVVLELLRLLAALKDYSKPHKDQYWRSLKDERLIPFLAFAISYGDNELVDLALHLYTHCAQSQSFQSRWLSDLVASCVVVKSRERERGVVVGGGANGSLDNSREINGNARGMSTEPDRPHSAADNKAVDELLNKMKHGMEIKDVRMSEMMATFEKKIAFLETRERELERLLSTKEAALQQSERMRIGARVNTASNEQDLARIRSLVAENEELNSTKTRLKEEVAVSRATADRLAGEKKRLLEEAERRQQDAETEISELTVKIKSLSAKVACLEEENAKETELNQQLRDHKEDLKKKLAIMSSHVETVEEENKKERDLNNQLREHKNDLKTKLATASDTIVQLRSELQGKNEELSEATGKLERYRLMQSQLAALASGKI